MWITDTSVRRPVFATMVIAALVVFGLLSLGQIGLDLMPEVDFPYVTITTYLPGADPQTVETEVSDRIEEACITIDSIKMIASNSLEGVSIVVIEFELEKDVDIAVQDVRDKISGIRQELPDSIEEPLVEKLDFNAIPVINVVVYGKTVSPDKENEEIRRLTEFTKNEIKERLQGLPGVGSVTMIGGQEREVRIWLDADKMRGYNLAVAQVMNVLRSENLEIPGGRIETRAKEWVVKTQGRFENVEEFNDLIISYYNGRPVRLKDIGYAEDGMEDLRSIAYIQGRRAVTLEIRKVSGANLVEVADNVKAYVDELQAIVPDDITVQCSIDNSEFSKQAINDVKDNLVIGGILAVLTILFFLRSFRTSMIAAVVLPTSVITTFAAINSLGFTLNQLTMLALTISIGMLIDDAVVIIENIYRRVEMGEQNTRKAAIEAVGEIGLAVVTTSFTVMGVFVPVAFMTGLIGQFFYEFGLTVTFAVGISTFISLTLTPLLCSRFLRPHKGAPKHNLIYRGITSFLRSLDRGYRVLLGGALRFRWLTLFIAIAIFVGSLMLAGLLPTEFFPEEDQSRFSMGVKAPLGSSVYETLHYTQQLEALVKDMPGVSLTFITVGGGAQGKVNEAQVIVEMVRPAERNFTQAQLMAALRDKINGNFPDLQISMGELQQVGGGGWNNYQVNYSLRGTNIQQLAHYANLLIEKLKSTPGFVEIATSYEEGKPEIGVTIDRDKAADLGVSVGSVAMAISALIGGEDVTTFESAGEQYDVRVRLIDTDRDQAEDIKRLLVSTNNGGVAELANLVSVHEDTGPVQIDRRNRMREIKVMSNLTSDLALGDAAKLIDQFMKDMNVPADIRLEHVGMTEVMQESFESMGFSLFLAIIVIYMVLASLFESFVHPLTIMMSLPLSIAGALGLLLVAGKSMNIMSMIGIIMLMGLVTKNAILLVDFTIRLRKQGMERLEALLTAGPRRLRPILMTTISTICGSIPVALGLGEGAETRSPMGIAVIGGLVTSTLLTLVVVPVVYTMMDDLGNLRLFRWIMKPFRQVDAAAEEAASHTAGTE